MKKIIIGLLMIISVAAKSQLVTGNTVIAKDSLKVLSTWYKQLLSDGYLSHDTLFIKKAGVLNYYVLPTTEQGITKITAGEYLTGGIITDSGTIGVGTELSALAAYSATSGGGIVAKTGVNAFANRTFIANYPLSITNGGGLDGNPLIEFNTSVLDTLRTKVVFISDTAAMLLPYLPKSGGTMNGKIYYSGVPTEAEELINKNALDNAMTGITWKNAVKAKTTTNSSLSGTASVDGTTIPAGTRILVASNTDAKLNGIYVSAAGAWTRALDCDDAEEIENSTCLVTNGTANKNTQWTCTATDITLGVSNITYGQIAGAGTYTNGSGINLTANVFSIIPLGITNSMVNDVGWSKVTGTPTTISGYGITDAQSQLNGTGFVKATGTTISYDNSTYLTAASAASTYLPLAGGTMTGSILATDNLHDLGASGATRFRSGFFGTSLISPLFGANTNSPTHTLTLGSTSTGITSYNTSDQTTNYERVREYWSGNVFNITQENGGTGVNRGMNIGSSTSGGDITIRGYNVNISGGNSIVATGAFSTSTDMLVGGSLYFSDAVNVTKSILFNRQTTNTAGTQNLTVTAGAPSTSNSVTNTNGGELALKGGISKGTGTSWISFYTAAAGVSGFADNTPAERMRLTGAGSLIFNTDGTSDIGASGATRPRTGYFQTSVIAPAHNSATGGVTFNVSGGTSNPTIYSFGGSGGASGTSGIISQYTYGGTYNPASGTPTNVFMELKPIINWGGTPGAGTYEGLRVNVTETSVPTGSKLLINLGTGGGSFVSKFNVDNSGKLTLSTTITPALTTGAQTINKSTGQVNFAAGATTLVVTNSLATISSQVMVTVYGADATAVSARVTKAAGSFTITLNAAATAETAVGFWVIN